MRLREVPPGPRADIAKGLDACLSTRWMFASRGVAGKSSLRSFRRTSARDFRTSGTADGSLRRCPRAGHERVRERRGVAPRVVTVPGVRTLEEITYEPGRSALADQESLVAGIRRRTGTLLAAPALVASFQGATTVKAHALHALSLRWQLSCWGFSPRRSCSRRGSSSSPSTPASYRTSSTSRLRPKRKPTLWFGWPPPATAIRASADGRRSSVASAARVPKPGGHSPLAHIPVSASTPHGLRPGSA